MAELTSPPWRTDKIESAIVIRQDTLDYMGTHIAAHATMLHGLFSDSVLPSSEYAFVGQAWSISVEWQFYLVAPFLFWLLVTKRWHALAAMLALMCIISFHQLWWRGIRNSSEWVFLVGLLSYYAYRRLEGTTVNSHAIDGIAMVTIAIAYMFVNKSISLVIWAAVFALLIADQQYGTLPQRIGLSILHHRTMQWLGKISYSIYVVHGLVIFATAGLILRIVPDIERWTFMAVLMVSTVIGTIIISALSYRFVERPGIDLGQRLSSSVMRASASAERA